MNQNSEHITQDSSLSLNKTSTQQQNFGGPDQRKIIRPNQLNWKFYAGAIIKSVTTKHAVCRITFMLYPILL